MKKGKFQINFAFKSILKVLDEGGWGRSIFRHGYPAAFCYSNQTDVSSMALFFSKIKGQVGEFSTRVFMSDDAASYYNAFKLIFGQVEHRLLCS